MTFQERCISLVFILIATICCLVTNAYDDIELKCKSGERVAKFNREGGSNITNVTRLTMECQPFLPSASSLKGVKCQESKPISCSSKMQGCTDPNTWIGGFNQFQIDPKSIADILVPICCSASNVEVVPTDCIEYRLNSFKTAIDYTLKPDYVATLMTCWALTDTHNILRDEIIKVKQCRYKVDGKYTFNEEKPTTKIVKQALLLKTDFPKPPATTIFNNENGNENDIQATPKPLSNNGNENEVRATSAPKTSSNSGNCAPCLCQCPAFECPDNRRAIKRLVRQKRGDCVCHCFCDYRCAQ